MVYSRAGWAADATHNAADAGNAIDGSAPSRWTSEAFQEPGMQFDLDMLESRSVRAVIVDTTSSAGDALGSYELYVTDDLGTPGAVRKSGAGAAFLEIELSSLASGRYVRVEQTDSDVGSWWSIHEIYVSRYYPRSAWSASSSHNTGDAALTLDYNFTNRWASQATQAPGMQLDIDMGSQRDIDEIVVDSASHASDAMVSYEIYVSTNGTDWTGPIASGSGAAVTTISFDKQTCRHFRIEQTGTSASWWSVNEVFAGLISEEDVAAPAPALVRWSGRRARSWRR